MLICPVCISLECTIIVLMNNSLLDGQYCTNYVDVELRGSDAIGRDDMQVIIPRINFTCNGTITGFTAGVYRFTDRNEHPVIQVWRPALNGSEIYHKIGEVQLLDHQVTRFRSNRFIVNITLTDNNTIAVQSGDVVGCYHPPDTRYPIRTRPVDGYVLYQFSASHPLTSVDLSNANRINYQQPLIQFTIGKLKLPYCECILFKMTQST